MAIILLLLVVFRYGTVVTLHDQGEERAGESLPRHARGGNLKREIGLGIKRDRMLYLPTHIITWREPSHKVLDESNEHLVVELNDVSRALR